MPGPYLQNPVPYWLRPENASVLDSPLTKAARTIASLTGINDPQSQVLALLNPMVPEAWASVQSLDGLAAKAQNGPTIGAARVGDRYIPPSFAEIMTSRNPAQGIAENVLGPSRPRSVQALDPYGAEAYMAGTGPAPGILMGATEEVGGPISEMLSRYKPDNPFAKKAAAARERYQRLTGQAVGQDATAQSFPLGVGYGRPSNASIDRTVRSGVDLVKAAKDLQSIEAKAEAFDKGHINRQGYPISHLDIEEATSKDGRDGFRITGSVNGRQLNVFSEHRTVADRVRKKLLKGDPLTAEDLQP